MSRRVEREGDVSKGMGSVANGRCSCPWTGGVGLRDGSRRTGFTLMELLVVIAIMVIVMGVTIPMVRGLAHGNSVAQTENMVTAYLASARSSALAMKAPVALVFFTDHSGGQARPAIQLVRQVPYAADIREAHFSSIAERPPEYLPAGVEVVTIADKYGPLRSENSFTNCRVVLFDGEGQVMLRDGLVGDNPDWNMNGTQSPPPAYVRGNSSPGVIVYDSLGLSRSGLTGGAAEDWIFRNGKVMVLNAYTGNVIR